MGVKDRGFKWDGKTRVSNDVYRKNFNEIFKPKEEDPFKKKVKKEKISDEELQKILDRNGF